MKSSKEISDAIKFCLANPERIQAEMMVGGDETAERMLDVVLEHAASDNSACLKCLQFYLDMAKHINITKMTKELNQSMSTN